MTLKQKRFLNKLPKNNFNISKTMKEAGYTDKTSVSGKQYQSLRKLTDKIDYFDPKQIKKDIMTTFRMAKKVKDITNLNRNLEHRSRIAGMITEKTQDVPIDKDTNQFSLDRLGQIKNTN